LKKLDQVHVSSYRSKVFSTSVKATMEESAVAKSSMSVRKVFLAKLESIYTGKARQARENRLQPPVHEFGQRLDGTGQHPVYGPHPSHKDSNGVQP
jgi:hypothetical protein